MRKRASSASDLQAFNNLVLQYQDEVYSLAFYLLGNEMRACEAVEQTFVQVYRQQPFAARTGRAAFRSLALRSLVRVCRRLLQETEKPSRSEVREPLSRLPFEDQALVALVDVLGLDYQEAAAILGWQTTHLRRRLALARARLSDLLEAGFSVRIKGE